MGKVSLWFSLGIDIETVEKVASAVAQEENRVSIAFGREVMLEPLDRFNLI